MSVILSIILANYKNVFPETGWEERISQIPIDFLFLKILSDTLYVKLYQFLHPILFVKMYKMVFFLYIP